MSDEAESNELFLWEEVEETDPKYTKTSDYGAKLTSINAAYLMKKATAIWGPFGDKWGASVNEERYEKGHCPTITGQDGSIITLDPIQNHTCIIDFFYPNSEGEKITFKQYGHTAFITYNTTYNNYTTDFEAPKKSFTDAIKKALSMLGFGGDIHMGEFDQVGYQDALKTKIEIDESLDKVAISSEKLEEFIDWFDKETAVYEIIPNQSGLKLTNDRHRQQIKLKCAAIGADHTKLLEKQSRLMAEAVQSLKSKEESNNGQ